MWLEAKIQIMELLPLQVTVTSSQEQLYDEQVVPGHLSELPVVMRAIMNEMTNNLAKLTMPFFKNSNSDLESSKRSL